MTFHKEGIPTLTLAIAFVVALNFAIGFENISSFLNVAAFIFSALILIVVLQFFRKPKRDFTQIENAVLAPADGKVVVIEKVQETEFFNEERIQVSIFMSPVNVHINWAPISGIAKFVKYHPGKFLVAWHPKASSDNERSTIVIENQKVTVLYRQIAGALARRIVNYLNEGDKVSQGQEVGFIKFGSRVDLFLPLDANIKVNLNEKVSGRKTLIAEY